MESDEKGGFKGRMYSDWDAKGRVPSNPVFCELKKGRGLWGWKRGLGWAFSNPSLGLIGLFQVPRLGPTSKILA